MRRLHVCVALVAVVELSVLVPLQHDEYVVNRSAKCDSYHFVFWFDTDTSVLGTELKSDDVAPFRWHLDRHRTTYYLFGLKTVRETTLGRHNIVPP